MKAADHHHDHSKHLDLSQVLARRPGHSPQFNSCHAPPTLLKYTAALACCVFCRQHLHGYTTPNIPHGQAIHVSSVGSLSHLWKFGTISKQLPLKKYFRDIHSKDLFMSGKTRSTKYTMQTERLALKPRTNVLSLHRDRSPTECTLSCKAWLSSVVTLWHHQNLSQNQTTCLNLKNPDLNRKDTCFPFQGKNMYSN